MAAVAQRKTASRKSITSRNESDAATSHAVAAISARPRMNAAVPRRRLSPIVTDARGTIGGAVPAAKAMRELVIDGTRITDDGDCYVIAEIGHNHQGSVEQAQQLFLAAAQCGVNAVKLQKRDNRSLYTRAAYEAPYDHENSFGATYGEHREALEFDVGEYRELQACAQRAGPRLLRHRLRRAERRSPGRARHARLQDRLRRPLQHAAATARGLARQADDRVHRRRDHRGRRPRRRDGARRSTRRSACSSARPPIRRRSRSSSWA